MKAGTHALLRPSLLVLALVLALLPLAMPNNLSLIHI